LTGLTKATKTVPLTYVSVGDPHGCVLDH
jgi:hypothetical protein